MQKLCDDKIELKYQEREARNKSLLCHLCDTLCESYKSLENHLLLHLAKKYKCDECHKEFHDVSNLNVHKERLTKR